MAAVSGTYTTATAVGQREDLTDAIYQISPEKTPFTSMIGRGKASATLHEWQIDELAAVDTANKRAEGNDASFTEPDPTVRLGNHTQISDKTAIVSRTLQSVKKAGRANEMAKQMAKRSAELKRDVESILLSNQAASGTDPRATGSLLAFIKTNVSKAGDGANPSYTTLPNDTRDDGTQRALTEQFVKDVVALCWNEGAEPSILMAGAFNKAAISAFAGNADKVVNLAGAKPGVIVGSMDVYVSEFGNLKVVPNRFQRTRDLLVLDPSMCEIDYLDGYQKHKLAKTGDAEKRLINVEYTLKVKNEKGVGGVFDLTVS